MVENFAKFVENYSYIKNSDLIALYFGSFD